MKKERKSIKLISIILIVSILFLSFVSAVQTIQVSQEQTQAKKSIFGNTFSFLKSNIFWGAVIIILFIVIIAVGLFFLVRWLVKFFKERSDIFWCLKAERIKLSKIQRRYGSKHFWKVHKNTPIRLVKKENNKLIISQPIGYHRGDYTSNEGNVIISLNLAGNKKYWFIPITSLLVIPDKDRMEISFKDEKGKKQNVIMDNLPRAREIVQFNENEILIFAESLSCVGLFYVPVLKTEEGKIIDLSLPVYQSLKEVILGNYLYEQSADFVALSKKAVELNPFIRGYAKISDSNTSVEVPQGEQRNKL